MLKKFAMAACLALGTLAYGGATAAVFSCTPNISTLLSGGAACQYNLDAADDDVSSVPFTVNEEAFFTFTDWRFDSRIFDSPTGAGGQGGSWDITSIFKTSWIDVMLIFKGGADAQFDMNGLVGYLLEDGVLSGTWESPFRNPPFTDLGSGQTQNTLHISVYFRTAREVAEPTTLALLAFGLVGLGLARRRQN